MTEIQEIYKEDTVGRRYHVPIVSKKGAKNNDVKAGDVVTVNLEKPINRANFNKLSDMSKATYIKHIHDRFGVTSEQVATMLGYSPTHFRSGIIRRLNLQGVFKRNGRPSKKQLSDWKKFLTEFSTSTDVSTDESSKLLLKKQESPMTSVCDCSFTLKGELSVSDIANKIQALIVDGTQCAVSVEIKAITS